MHRTVLSVPLAALAAAALLAACGGGGSKTPERSPAPVMRGVFVDAPVANLAYRTATLSGRTGADGSFQYRVGEAVTFSIGEIHLPAVSGADVLSPATVFGAAEVSSSTGAVNFARLLQTLDADLDPSNGISIADAAHAAATAAVDFGSASFDAAVEHLVTTVQGDGATLVSAGQATAHVEDQLRAGGYLGGPAAEPTVIVLFPDGRYVEVEGNLGNSDGAGVEFGTYAWDAATHEFVGYVGTLDTNHSPALATQAPGPAHAWFHDSEAVFDPGNGTTAAFARAHDAANPIVGTWVTGSMAGNDAVVVTYLANGKYVMGHGGTADADGQPGVEYGTYTWNATSGAWTALSGSPDTNGSWGFSDPLGTGHVTATGTVTIDGSRMTMVSGGTTLSWTRVGL